jgi:hypothetical protein
MAINMRNVALKIHSTFHLRNRNLRAVMLEAFAAYQSYKSTEVVLLSYLSSISLKMLQKRN